MTDYVVPLYALRARRKGHEVTVMKELMTMLGLRGGAVRPPLVPLGPTNSRNFAAVAPMWQKVAGPSKPRRLERERMNMHRRDFVRLAGLGMAAGAASGDPADAARRAEAVHEPGGAAPAAKR